MMALTVCEALNLHIRDNNSAPVTYLNGTLLFIAGLSIVRVHNRWKVIYTMNTIESLNMSLRKIIKMRGSFPNNEAAMKLLYLALRNAAKKWTMPVQNWSGALNRFSILRPDRMPALDRV